MLISWNIYKLESLWQQLVEVTFKSTCHRHPERDPLYSLSDRTIRLAMVSIRGLSCRFTTGVKVPLASGRWKFKTKDDILVRIFLSSFILSSVLSPIKYWWLGCNVEQVGQLCRIGCWKCMGLKLILQDQWGLQQQQQLRHHQDCGPTTFHHHQQQQWAAAATLNYQLGLVLLDRDPVMIPSLVPNQASILFFFSSLLLLLSFILLLLLLLCVCARWWLEAKFFCVVVWRMRSLSLFPFSFPFVLFCFVWRML